MSDMEADNYDIFRVCWNCAFWHHVDEGFGECHAKAPRLVDDNGKAWWPSTMDTDWCGEMKVGTDRELRGENRPVPIRYRDPEGDCPQHDT